MSTILLTSFFNSRKLPDTYKKYSVAVYQPTGFDYPKLDCWEIRNENGEWIRPRDFVEGKYPLLGYREALMNLYISRLSVIRMFMNELEQQSEYIALCCWCPYDKAAQRQLKQFGSFVCHTEVIRGVLKMIGYEVSIDDDRKKMKKLWRF